MNWRIVERYNGRIVTEGTYGSVMRQYRAATKAEREQMPELVAKRGVTTYETAHWVMRVDESFTDYATVGRLSRWRPGCPFPA